MLFVSLLSFLPGCLSKKFLPKPHPGDLYGEVCDSLTGEPVPDVSVAVGDRQMFTDMDGYFLFPQFPPGNYRVLLEHPWYHPQIYEIGHVGLSKRYSFKTTTKNIYGEILYSADCEPKRSIYSLELLTREVKRLTDLSFSVTNPVRLSQNKIIFQGDRDGNNDLFMFDLLTGQLSTEFETKVNSASNDEHPSVDRLGKKLVFQSTRVVGTNDSRKIFLYNLETGEGPYVVVKSGQNPVINPEGNKIAYIDGSYRLRIFGADLSFHPTPLPTPPPIPMTGKCNNPSWSEDGRKITLESWTVTGGPRYIFVYDLDQPGELKKVTFDYDPDHQSEHKHPCWSVDGVMIFFNASILYSSRNDIYCINYNNSLTLGKNAGWLMVSKGSGSKDYPSWGGD